mgnify:FL=1
MSRADIQIGDQFGRLTVVLQVKGPRRGRFYECSCSCGRSTLAYAGHLKSGERVSCGCRMAITKRKHGLSHTVEHRTWSRMKERCYNPHNKKYRDYGGRGIRVCDQWRTSFEAFLADMGPRPPGLTLDRIDNDGIYEPRNCRWATYSQQNLNRRPMPKRKAKDAA